MPITEVKLMKVVSFGESKRFYGTGICAVCGFDLESGEMVRTVQIIFEEGSKRGSRKVPVHSQCLEDLEPGRVLKIGARERKEPETIAERVRWVSQRRANRELILFIKEMKSSDEMSREESNIATKELTRIFTEIQAAISRQLNIAVHKSLNPLVVEGGPGLSRQRAEAEAARIRREFNDQIAIQMPTFHKMKMLGKELAGKSVSA